MKNEIGVNKASQILGVSKKTIYNKLRSGELNGEKKKTKFGEKWVMDKEEVKNYKNSPVSENEVVEIEQVNELVSINEFKRDLSEIHSKQLEEQLDKAVKALNEQNKQDKEEIIEKLDKQQEINEQLLEKIQQLQEEKNQSLWAKIKNLFT
jgi:excisionase family DNA binding protein